MNNHKVALAAACAVVVGGAFFAWAATCTFNGAWDAEPTEAADEIVVQSGNVTWGTSLPAKVASWTQSGGTVTFDTGLEAFEVTGSVSLTGGTWTHTANPSFANTSEGWKPVGTWVVGLCGNWYNVRHEAVT